MNRRLLLKLVVAALAALPLALPAAAADKVTVFAAASLKNALDAANAAWQTETGNETAVSYAASSALAKQIEAAAPADLFISADLAWMDYVAEKKLIKDDTRVNLLGNRIVLVAPKDKASTVEIKDGFDLAGLVGDGKLAMGAVDSVPAGKYGKAALETLGVWASVENSLAQAENVRAALLLVARGEAPLGVVYGSDAKADPRVRVLAVFPPGSHPPIVYPVARIRASTQPRAAGFVRWLQSPEASAIFREHGFSLL